MNRSLNRSKSTPWFAAAALVAAMGAGVAVAQTSAPTPTPATPAPAAPQAAPGTPGSGPMGAGAPHAHRGARGDDGASWMMKRFDTDKDGQLSRSEFESGQQATMKQRMQAFEAADTDKNGKLTADEMRAFRDSMRAQMGATGQPGGHRHGEPGMRGPRATPGTVPPAETKPGA